MLSWARVGEKENERERRVIIGSLRAGRAIMLLERKKLGGARAPEGNLNPDLDLAEHLQAILDLSFQDFLLLEHGFVALENDVVLDQVGRS